MLILMSFEVVSLFCFFAGVLANPVPSLPDSNILQLPSNANLAELTSSSVNNSLSAPAFETNTSFSFLSPVTDIKGAQPVCESRFGTDLSMSRCWDALRSIADDTKLVSFGRNERFYDIQVPRRISSPDGTCVIDIFLKDEVTPDYSNFRQIAAAASSVVFQCVRASQNYMGGYIRDIGNAKNLVIVVSAYQPAVDCYGSVGNPRTASQGLIDEIPTTWYPQVFGFAGTPGVEVILPKTYDQPWSSTFFNRFYVSLKIVDGKAVTTRWFDIWAAVIAINARCVGLGQAGKAMISGGLLVKLDRRYLPSGGTVSGSSNSSGVIDTA